MGTTTKRLQLCNFPIDPRYQLYTYEASNHDMWIVITDIKLDDIPLNVNDDCYIAYIPADNNPDNVTYSSKMTVEEAANAISMIFINSIDRSERIIRDFIREFGRVNARALNMLGGAE